MIGRLRGIVLSEEPTGALVLDVNGVGYELTTPVGTLGRAGAEGGGEVELWVHTYVREDALDLFGFATETDRRVFRLLITVPNVGPKTALGVLSALSTEDLARAVESADYARFSKVARPVVRRHCVSIGTVSSGRFSCDTACLQPEAGTCVTGA